MNKKLLVFSISLVLLFSCSEKSKNTFLKYQNIDYKTIKHSKNINIDSLYQVTSLHIDDTVKVNELIKIFKLSIKNKPLRNDILDEALQVSRNINYETGIANCLNTKGVNARYQNKYLKSAKLHKDALQHYKKSWDAKSKIKNLNSLGVSYRKLNMESEALTYYFEALKLSEKLDDTKSMAMALNGIGNAYLNQKKYKLAKTYFKLALNLETLNKNEKGMGYDYSNLGEVYMYEKKYDSSYTYHMKSLKIAQKLGYSDNVAIINNTLGSMFQYKGEYKKSLMYFDKAISVLKTFRNQRYLSNTLINRGINYFKLKQFQEAEDNILEGLAIAKKISSKENIILGNEALSILYEERGNYKKSLDKYKLMTIYRDSVFNMQSESNIAAMGIKYNSEKKDEQIKHLNLENQIQKSRIIIQFLAIGLLIIGILFFIFYNRLRLKNNNLEMKAMRHKIETYLQQISSLEHNDASKKIEIAKKAQDYGLSSRETEVLNYISKGLKNQEIADTMFVSLSTVKTHTKNIFEKLDVRNRIEAARKAQVL